MKFILKLFFGALELHLESFLHILSLEQVPNPLFDLAGILCGQFNILFWKFFLATLIGKTIIKVYMQTTLEITLCNSQLLELVEERLVWVFSNFPGVSSVLPSLVAKLKTTKDKLLIASVAASASSAAKVASLHKILFKGQSHHFYFSQHISRVRISCPGRVTKSNASYCMGVSSDIRETILELRMKKAFSYVIFKIKERQKQAVVKKTRDTTMSYDDFIATLLENACRYALYDFDFVTVECAEKKDFLLCLKYTSAVDGEAKWTTEALGVEPSCRNMREVVGSRKATEEL